MSKPRFTNSTTGLKNNLAHLDDARIGYDKRNKQILLACAKAGHPETLSADARQAIQNLQNAYGFVVQIVIE